MVDATYQREDLSPLWPELLPLLDQHWKEIAHYQDVPLEPDIERYNVLEQAGMVRVYTARLPSWELVGYIAFFVTPNMHYRSLRQASQDVLFLRADLRRSGLGRSLIAFADEQLKAEGIQVAYHHMKAAHSYAPILERMGYELVDLIYAKRLDR